jgi:phosphohistidine phosphatase
MSVPRDLEVYLVRHAPAGERGPEWPDDTLRPLSAEGRKSFQKVVKGLAAADVELDVIFTSPLVRCRQTADILSSGLRGKPRVHPIDSLAPGAGAPAVIAEIAGLLKRPRIALVGHEPDLGKLAAQLLGLKRPPEFRKGGVARIDLTGLPPSGPALLVWFAPPRLLRRMAP